MSHGYGYGYDYGAADSGGQGEDVRVDRSALDSNPPQVRVLLPDGQVLLAALRERRQEADGSWWALVGITLIVRFQSADGRLTGEPEPVVFWAPMARGVVTPIEGEDYRQVSTFRNPELLRRQARARVPGRGRGPRREWG